MHACRQRRRGMPAAAPTSRTCDALPVRAHELVFRKPECRRCPKQFIHFGPSSVCFSYLNHPRFFLYMYSTLRASRASFVSGYALKPVTFTERAPLATVYRTNKRKTRFLLFFSPQPSQEIKTDLCLSRLVARLVVSKLLTPILFIYIILLVFVH